VPANEVTLDSGTKPAIVIVIPLVLLQSGDRDPEITLSRKCVKRWISRVFADKSSLQ